MKKLFISAAAAALVAALAMPASALENQFGGYWRTRAYSFDNFADGSIAKADSRTRLYYTAKFSDNFKFVNKFEFNTNFGQTTKDAKFGGIGADANGFLIKNSYADFTLGNVNYKVGTQGGYIARGFLMDDDFSGATITYDAGDFTIPFIWVKAVEGNVANADDADYYVVSPKFNAGNLSLNPVLFYMDAQKVQDDPNTTNVNEANVYGDAQLYYLGVNGDIDMDAMSAWFSFIYQTGEKNSVDKGAFFAAAGAKADMGAFGLHGKVLYGSGSTDGKGTWEAPKGRSYYWSEILGYGIFDAGSVTNSPTDGLSNVMALNAGASMSPMENLTVSADLWYAQLNEKAANGKTDLGTEIDLKATYKLMDNLNLDVVGAYLIAGDAVGANDDPYEFGTRLSLSF